MPSTLLDGLLVERSGTQGTIATRRFILLLAQSLGSVLIIRQRRSRSCGRPSISTWGVIQLLYLFAYCVLSRRAYGYTNELELHGLLTFQLHLDTIKTNGVHIM